MEKEKIKFYSDIRIAVIIIGNKIEGILRRRDFHRLTEQQMINLSDLLNENLFKIVLMGPEVAKGLTEEQVIIIADLYRLIDKDHISLREALAMSKEEARNLSDKSTQEKILCGVLSIEDGKKMIPGRPAAVTKETDIGIHHDMRLDTLIEKGILSRKDVYELTPEQRANLLVLPVRNLVEIRLMDLEVAKNLTEDQVLIVADLYSLISNRCISLSEAFGMSEKEVRNLADKSTQEKILCGELSIEDGKKIPGRPFAVIRRMTRLEEQEKEKSEEMPKPGAHGGGGSGGGR